MLGVCSGGEECRLTHGVPLHGTVQSLPRGDKPELAALKFLTSSHSPLQLLCSNGEKNHGPSFPDGGTEKKRGCSSTSFTYLCRFQRLGYGNTDWKVASGVPVTLWLWEAGRLPGHSPSLQPGNRFLQGTLRMVMGWDQLPTAPVQGPGTPRSLAPTAGGPVVPATLASSTRPLWLGRTAQQKAAPSPWQQGK